MRATVLFIDYAALKAIETFGHGDVESNDSATLRNLSDTRAVASQSFHKSGYSSVFPCIARSTWGCGAKYRFRLRLLIQHSMREFWFSRVLDFIRVFPWISLLRQSAASLPGSCQLLSHCCSARRMS